ncbi:MAG: HU family DNA-binding protein [Candidatus Aminicenantes bacterium]|nr:MAG: HU family DNA-binding protein [Candidatus Aminicenantes bacterium]
MNKKELTAKMSRDAGITSRQAEKAFSSLIEGIKVSLKKEKRVTISGFGSFEVKKRKARKAKNPRTGEVINIPKKKRIKLNPSKTFTNSL